MKLNFHQELKNKISFYQKNNFYQILNFYQIKNKLFN